MQLRVDLRVKFDRIPSFLLREFSDHSVQNDLLPIPEAATEHYGFIVLCRVYGFHLIVRRNQKSNKWK